MKKVFLVIFCIFLIGLGFAAEEKANRFTMSFMLEEGFGTYYLGYRMENLEILGGVMNYSYDKSDHYGDQGSAVETKIYGVKLYLGDSYSQLNSYVGVFGVSGKDIYYHNSGSSSSYYSDNKEEMDVTGTKYCIGAQYFINEERSVAINGECGVIKTSSKGKSTNDSIEEDMKASHNQTYAGLGLSFYL